MDTFFCLYFHFCFELALKIWATAFWHNLFRFMIPITPTQLRAFNGQGSPTSECSTWLNAAYKSRNGAPTKGGEWLLSLFVLTRWEMVQPVLTKAVLYPAKAAAMCMASCAEIRSPPLSHHFCYHKTYLSSNWLRQLIICGLSQTRQMVSSVVKGLSCCHIKSAPSTHLKSLL